MARKDRGLLQDLLDLLVELPWWVSICFTAALYVFLRFVVPTFQFDDPVFSSIPSIVPAFAWLALVFLIPAPVSAIKAYQKRRLLDSQRGIESIRALSWKEFEELLAEAYRRSGYAVRENQSAGPDGGIDLVIERNGNRYLVQCKQWRAQKVGVKVVREMFGVMTAEQATGAIVVTSGMFTQEARNFATGKPIDLVEGSQLAEMIRNVQPRPTASQPLPPTPTSDPAECPLCGKDLILRTARRGANAGSRFWGCKGYPACRYTRPHDA